MNKLKDEEHFRIMYEYLMHDEELKKSAYDKFLKSKDLQLLIDELSIDTE